MWDLKWFEIRLKLKLSGVHEARHNSYAYQIMITILNVDKSCTHQINFGTGADQGDFRAIFEDIRKKTYDTFCIGLAVLNLTLQDVFFPTWATYTPVHSCNGLKMLHDIL